MKRMPLLLRAGLLAALCLLTALPAAAQAPYETYTYAYNGDELIAPNAYTPVRKLSSFGEAGTLNTPSDIVLDGGGNLLIADRGNDRILVLDRGYQCIAILADFTGEAGQPDALKAPEGVFVAWDGSVYVADTGNGRVVVFGEDYSFQRIVEAPPADSLPENYLYQPSAVAVDRAGRLYVISKNTNMGVVALEADGSFVGFVGAQKVTVSLIDLLWRSLMSQEQIDRSRSFVPVEYNNLTVDGEGFLYVTTSSIDRYALYNDRRSRSSDNTPIKKFNPNGTDILMKTGFFAPIGDVNFDPYGSGTEEATMPSKIREVCLAGEDSYFLVDGEYSKLFYYDEYGNLLYAFGGQGDSLGLFRQLAAVAADGDRLVALDEVDGSLTEFTRTDYGRALEQAVSYQNNRQFDQAIPAWEALIQDNNNLDLAYYNIAKSRMEQGDYREAMEGFRLVDNREYYSKAYKLYRQQQLKRYGGYIALGVLAGIALLAFLFSRLGRLNEKTHRHAGPVKLKRQMAFSVYTMLHPFKGFAEVKAEGRGSVLSASLLLGAAALSSVYQGLGSSYLQKDVDNPATVVSALANLLLPFALWCVANWCVTSLLDGKGTMKDIYIASAYALIPLILVTIPATLLSHLLIQEELVILDMATGLAGFWTVLLMGASLLVVHDYTAGKTLGAALLILAGMVFMLFLVMIFVSLLSQMGVTVTAIIKELSYRM